MKYKCNSSKTQPLLVTSIISYYTYTMTRLAAFLFCVCINGVANAAPFAYISNSEDGTVSVIDLATDSVVKTIAVGVRPLGVAVTRDGTKVYVTDLLDKSITMIDGQDQTVLTKKSLDIIPKSVAVNSSQSRVYVVGGESGREKPRSSSVLVLDANTLETLHQIPLMLKEEAIYIAVAPDDAHVWVSVGKYEVIVIDTSTNTIAQEITIQAGSLSPLVFGENPRMTYIGGRSSLIAVNISSNPPDFQKIHMMAGGDTQGLAVASRTIVRSSVE